MSENGTISKSLYGLFAIIYIIVTTVTFYSDNMFPKIAGMITIPIAIIMFMVNPDFDRVKKTYEFPVLLIAGLIITYAFSVFVWLVNIEEAIYIGNGTTRIVFYVINVIVAYSVVYIFGSKAVDYTLYSALLMNGYYVVTGLLQYGLVQSFHDLMNAFTTGAQEGFMHTTEINQMSFSYGFFIIYYLFISDYSKKRKAILISTCLIFAILGYKRINIAAMLVAIIFAVIFMKLPKDKHKRRFMYFLGIATAVTTFLYIPFIRNGWFEAIMNYFEIETNTRIDLYNFIKDIYVFSPTFTGQGIDYIKRYFEYLKSIHVYYKGASLQYLHNDVLVKYIEMGFWGFCGWLYVMCITGLKWMHKHCGLIAGGLYAIITVNNFINISTGNTNHSYCVRLVIEVILISTICKILIENPQRKANSEEFSDV